jgi:transposase-like protein
MESTTCYCPHPQCTHYGQRGFGTHRVHCGADRGLPRLLCTLCKGTFSVRQGIAYFGVHAEEPNSTIAMRALAEGNSLRGTGRIVDVDKDTVCDWVDRAGRHCRAVTTSLFDTLHITECQVDEWWSFVRKKEAHLTVAEKVLALYGDACGCGSPVRQPGAWWLLWWWVNAIKRTPTCCSSVCTRSVAGLYRSLPAISCRTMLTPCCMCMAHQRSSCTYRQTWPQAHSQAPPSC